MAWSPEHKEQSRQKILRSAADLFTEKGYDPVGIDEIMKNAGMTRGAFYSHFSSKAELYSAAIYTASPLKQIKVDPNAPGVIDAVIEHYFSEQHRNGSAFRCPLAFLVSDIAQREDIVRETYTQLFREFTGFLNVCAESREDALRSAALMIGSIAISRSLEDSELAHELLKACQTGTQSVLKTPAGKRRDADKAPLSAEL